jgi:hypothetical protein
VDIKHTTGLSNYKTKVNKYLADLGQFMKAPENAALARSHKSSHVSGREIMLNTTTCGDNDKQLLATKAEVGSIGGQWSYVEKNVLEVTTEERLEMLEEEGMYYKHSQNKNPFPPLIAI